MPAKIRATVWFVLDRRVTSHHGQQTAAEGGGGNAEIARTQQDGHCRAEARPGGGPQNVRRHHGVAEHPLIRRAGHRQRRSHQGSRRHPGQPHGEHHLVVAEGPVRRTAGDLCPQHMQQLPRGQGIPS